MRSSRPKEPARTLLAASRAIFPVAMCLLLALAAFLRLSSPFAHAQDGDGYTIAEGDCDDTAPGIHPGAVDLADGDGGTVDTGLQFGAIAWMDEFA